MPTYQYKCSTCEISLDKSNVAIDERDEQICEDCNNKLERVYVIGNVSVWAPTAGGFR